MCVWGWDEALNSEKVCPCINNYANKCIQLKFKVLKQICLVIWELCSMVLIRSCETADVFSYILHLICLHGIMYLSERYEERFWGKKIHLSSHLQKDHCTSVRYLWTHLGGSGGCTHACILTLCNNVTSLISKIACAGLFS